MSFKYVNVYERTLPQVRRHLLNPGPSRSITGHVRQHPVKCSAAPYALNEKSAQQLKQRHEK